MAQYLSTTPQVLTADSPVILQSTEIKGGCSISHRDGTPTVTVKGSGCACNPARYKVFVHVTISAPAAAVVQLALAEDGVIMPETLMSLPPVSEGTILSASTGKTIQADACCDRITIVAITDATVQTALLSVERVA